MHKGAVLLTILVALILAARSYLILSVDSKPDIPVSTFTSTDKERPKAETGKTIIDLGKIKVNDTVVEEFTVKNTGNKTLQLHKISSSCGCTAGQVIYGGKESREYSMHKISGVEAEIAPNTAAVIRMTYRPYTMPVFGKVDRELYMQTNDPDNPRLIFKISAFVE